MAQLEKAVVESYIKLSYADFVARQVKVQKWVQKRSEKYHYWIKNGEVLLPEVEDQDE